MDRLLYDALKFIKNNKTYSSDIGDSSYYDALDKVGIINKGWDTTLTALGNSIFEMLDGKFNKW